MPTVVGVKLRFAGRTLWFDPADTCPGLGDPVVVETERGTELGTVVEASHEVTEAELVAPLKPVLRVAGQSDKDRAARLSASERTAMPIFRELVKKHGLDMKPVDVEYLFGEEKVVFYFSAEERVDFRQLVRDLATEFKARIDMRQVGVRDEARMVGGLGHCGQQLCCVRLAGEFQPVSIRMAKEQDLPLNPLKISGLCGRLMCCLRYEYDAYKDFKSRAPKRGAMIETPMGEGKVVELNTPKETVTMRVGDSSLTVPLEVMECGSGKGCPCVVRTEALEQAGLLPPSMMGTIPEPEPAHAEEVAATPAKSRSRRSRSGGRGQAKPSDQTPRARKNEAGEAKQGEPGQTKATPAPASGRRRRRRRSSGGSEDKGNTPT